MSVSPNAITRNMAKAYTDIAEQLNVVSDIFSYGQRRAVDGSDLSVRWNWTANTNMGSLATINDIVNGLDGTSLYLYAGSDYKLVDPLFLIANVIDNIVSQTEVRPVTVYEGMLKLKQYVQSEIANNISPIINLTSSLENFLSGGDPVGNGTAVIIENDELSLSTWRFTEYNLPEVGVTPCLFNEHDTGIVAGDDIFAIKSSFVSMLGGPIGSTFIYDADGLYIDTQHENITLYSNENVMVSPGITFPMLTEPPTNPPAENVKLYYNGPESSFYYLDSGGANIPVGNGAGDTGLITFDGVKIIGAGTASGDGEGNGTIELVPDNDLYDISPNVPPNTGYGNGGQYLIIDPTVPGHIHMRAGGPIDQAAAWLILGGEKANVIVQNQDGGYNENHRVIINTHDNATTEYSWTFGNDGNLTVPNGSDILDENGNSLLFNHTETSPELPVHNIVMNTESTTYLVQADEDAHTLTLPLISSLTLGWEITIADIANSAATNLITVNTSSSDVFIGYDDDSLIIDTNNGLVRLQVTSLGWLILYSK
jgi:hypothetical protein